METFGRFLRALALISGGILLLLMFYTVLDVVLRYVFNAPFSGSLELTEFAMVPIVFLAIAYCGWTGGHISVDLFEYFLDRPGFRFLPALISFTGAGLFAVIAWRVTVEAIATWPQVSNMLRLPHYPFRLVVAFGAAVFAAVLLVQGAMALRRRPDSHDART